MLETALRVSGGLLVGLITLLGNLVFDLVVSVSRLDSDSDSLSDPSGDDEPSHRDHAVDDVWFWEPDAKTDAADTWIGGDAAGTMFDESVEGPWFDD